MCRKKEKTAGDEQQKAAQERLTALQNSFRSTLFPFVDFDNYQYRYANEPPECRLKDAWIKFGETERRLEMYKWAEALNNPPRPRYRTFLDDCVSAFLLTFESTLQFVKDFHDKCSEEKFDDWIVNQKDNDVTVKGLRTLRNLIAHVEIKPVPSAITAISGMPPKRDWLLHQLSKQDLEGRVNSKLKKETEFQEWNTLVQKKVLSICLRTDCQS